MLDKDRISELFHLSHCETSGSLLCVSEGGRLATWYSDFDEMELVNVYSISKLIVALAIYSAWENGMVDFDKPVNHYWPEFSGDGKEDITIRHVMEHSSGVPHFGEPLSTTDTYDWNHACSILARTRPLHSPGQMVVYHARTFGFLLGEVIRRTTGLTLSEFVDSNLATSSSKFYFGVPDEALPRVKKLSVPPDLESAPHSYRASQAKAVPAGAAPYSETVFQNPANAILAPNDLAWIQAALPSSGGVSNAVMIVDIMRSFFANHPRARERILSLNKNGVAACTDLALGIPVNWMGGFEGNNGEFGIGATRFGYRAIGGSIAFLDLHRELFVSYTTSVMIPQPGLHPAHDPRIENILDVLGATA